MSTDQTEKKPLSPTDLMQAMRGGTKPSACTILNGMTNQSDLHMITNIKNVNAFASALTISNYIKQNGLLSLAKIDSDYVEYSEKLAVSRKGDRAEKIIEATKVQAQAEFEVKKSGGLMGDASR